jgi:hypothetical protein
MTPVSSRRRAELAVASVALVAVLFLLLVPDAWAQAGNDVGRNLGGMLRRYAGEIYGGVVGVISLTFLVNRRYTELGLFLMAAVIVAWMVFSPDQVANAARGIGREVLR